MTEVERLEDQIKRVEELLPHLLSGTAVSRAHREILHLQNRIDGIQFMSGNQWTAQQMNMRRSVQAMNPDGTVEIWPINPWQQGDGLVVWDGDIRYECQAVQVYKGKIMAIKPMKGTPFEICFICGKCHGRTWDDSMLLLKPGDVCAVCFSVAIGKEPRDPFAEQMEHMRQTVYETIDLSPHPPYVMQYQTMTKEEFAKHYPNATIDGGETP